MTVQEEPLAVGTRVRLNTEAGFVKGDIHTQKKEGALAVIMVVGETMLLLAFDDGFRGWVTHDIIDVVYFPA